MIDMFDGLTIRDHRYLLNYILGKPFRYNKEKMVKRFNRRKNSNLTYRQLIALVYGILANTDDDDVLFEKKVMILQKFKYSASPAMIKVMSNKISFQINEKQKIFYCRIGEKEFGQVSENLPLCEPNLIYVNFIKWIATSSYILTWEDMVDDFLDLYKKFDTREAIKENLCNILNNLLTFNIDPITMLRLKFVFQIRTCSNFLHIFKQLGKLEISKKDGTIVSFEPLEGFSFFRREKCHGERVETIRPLKPRSSESSKKSDDGSHQSHSSDDLYLKKREEKRKNQVFTRKTTIVSPPSPLLDFEEWDEEKYKRRKLENAAKSEEDSYRAAKNSLDQELARKRKLKPLDRQKFRMRAKEPIPMEKEKTPIAHVLEPAPTHESTREPRKPVIYELKSKTVLERLLKFLESLNYENCQSMIRQVKMRYYDTAEKENVNMDRFVSCLEHLHGMFPEQIHVEEEDVGKAVLLSDVLSRLIILVDSLKLPLLAKARKQLIKMLKSAEKRGLIISNDLQYQLWDHLYKGFTFDVYNFNF